METSRVSYSPVYTVLNPRGNAPESYSSNQVDLKDLYTQEELDEMISRFDCLHQTFPKSEEKCKFDMVYLPTNESVVINNRNMTNDTVEIYKNGQAVSVGSWHHKVLEGDYSDIIKDVKAKSDNLSQIKEQAMTSQLDALAELGKSQVKQ